jgi:ubiquinone/menaquinone biosynthesis C-methylase UbiE
MVTWSSYWLSQNARVGWYLGQYLLSNRLGRPAKAARPRRRTGTRRTGRGPTLSDLLQDIVALFRKDWRNIRNGLYALPRARDDVPGRWLADTVLYFADFAQVNERRRRGGYDDVRRLPAADRAAFPDYYLRNFHYQTDGYLSERSARLYDHQVEVLFIGSADTMRRQALVPIAGLLRRRPGAPVHLDIACGTGRFLESVLDNFPRLRSTALDLSPYYLAAAERRLGPRPGLGFVQGLAECLPFADGSVDLVTCIYLLHEVPADIRARIAYEIARVLRAGGRAVFLDSLQFGDRPSWDGMLKGFPKTFHEPFYADYAAADLNGLFVGAGLRPAGSERAFLSKVIAVDKPV